MKINYVALRNEDTSKSACTPLVDPAIILNQLGIDNVVCEIAKKHCNVDDPHIYVEISKETFGGDACYSIGVLALDNELSEEELKVIKTRGLHLHVSFELSYAERFYSADLLVTPELRDFLDLRFKSLTNRR